MQAIFRYQLIAAPDKHQQLAVNGFAQAAVESVIDIGANAAVWGFQADQTMAAVIFIASDQFMVFAAPFCNQVSKTVIPKMTLGIKY